MNQDTYRRCQQEWEKDGMQMCEGPENTFPSGLQATEKFS